MSELLPCPLCGHEARLVKTDYELPWMVECALWLTDCESNCGCGTTSFATEAEAIATWNRRTPAQGVPVKVIEAINWLDEYSQPLVAKPDEWTRQWNIVRNWLDSQGQEVDE